MGGQVFYIKSLHNNPVQATYLTNANGQYIVDPNWASNNATYHTEYTDSTLSTLASDQNPNHYVLAPANFSFQTLNSYVSYINGLWGPLQYPAIAFLFRQGGALDTQRSYPGVAGFGLPFVSDDEPAFQTAASISLGYIGQQTVGLGTVEYYGGQYNLHQGGPNTTGLYGNNPQNVLSEECGADIAKGGTCPSPSHISFSDGSYSNLSTSLDGSGDSINSLSYYSGSGILIRADYVTTAPDGLAISDYSQVTDPGTGLTIKYNDTNGDGKFDTASLNGAGFNNLVINLAPVIGATSSNIVGAYDAALAAYGVGPSSGSAGSPPPTPLESLGFEIGSQVGELLAPNNPLAQIAGGTILSALGGTLQQYLSSDWSLVLQAHGDSVAQTIGDNIGASFQQVGTSLVSAQLTNELLHSLGIKGFGGQLASFAITPGVTAAITFEVNQLFPGLNLSAGVGLTPANIAAFFGQEIGQTILAPQTQAAAILADIGSDIGGAIGFSVAGPVGDFVGSLIGDVIGTIIGDLFGRRARPIPTASVSVVLQLPDAYYALGNETSTNGGDLVYVIDIANQAAYALNTIIGQVVGATGAVANSNSPTQTYGLNGSQLYVTFNGTTTNVASGDLAISDGVIWALKQTELIGGNIYEKRAIANSTAVDIVSLLADLQVADDYQKYRSSWQSINQALSDSPNSALTAGWIVSLQRANELRLNQFSPSDFYGGLKGFLSSFKEGGKSVRYEDFGLGWDGNGLTVADTANTANVFDLPQASANGASVYIANFLGVEGYAGQSPGSFSNGNDFATAAGWGSAASIDSWDSSTPGGNDIFVGSNYNDRLEAGTGNSWLDGGAGDDTLYAPGGSAVLLGGAGNDWIEVGQGSSPGTFYLSGGAGNDTLIAHAGNATFVGGTGQDRETGGSGKNAFIVDPSLQNGNASVSTLNIQGGGSGNTLSFERFGNGVYLDLRNLDLTHPTQGTQQVSTDTFQTFNGTLTFSDIQNITGGAGNDWICTTAGMSSTLNGGAGDDTLHGWGGNDTIEGGPGADTMNGWGGINTLTYEGSSAGVYVSLAAGQAYGGDATGDTFTSFQNITGSAFNDTLQATAGGVLTGNAGDDTLLYSGGSNSYIGGDGFDTVDYSSAGSAVIVNLQNASGGGAANGDTYSSIEKVIGTRYNDTLTASSTGSTFEGGGGTDTFNGGSASDTFILGRGDGYATVNDNNTDSNTIQIGPGLGFDDLWFGTAGGSIGQGGYLAVGVRQAGGAQTGDELYVPGNFGAYPLSGDNIIKDLNLNGSSSIDISQVTFVSGGTANSETLTGLQNAYSFLIGYEGSDTLQSTPNGQLSQYGTIFFGGTGNDYISASSGNNEFLFERGDGQDHVQVTGGQNTLIFGSTVSASDVIYQVDSAGNLFIGLKSTTNPSLTASQVSDFVEVGSGAIETINNNTGLTKYSASIQTVEAGGTTINLKQIGLPYVIQYTSGGGGVQQPVVLDLKGDGLEVSSVAGSDIGTVDGNGVVTRMSWVGPTDGILVTDRDGTGRYNTTDDISFVQDKPGATSDLQGLQAWDTNGDGVLNAQDSDWNKLKVWVDANQDGVAEAGEVETLAQAGVTSISLKETASGFDPSSTFDSYYTGTASFTRTDGSTGTAYDEALARRFLNQTTDAQSSGESWAQLTPDATIGQLQTSTVVATPSASSAASAAVGATATLASTLAAGVTAFTTSAAQAAKSGGAATINTLGSNKISSQDAALWSDVLNPVPGQLHALPGTFAGAQNLAAIQTSTAHPAGYDELTGRSGSAATTSRSAEPIVLDLAALGLSQIAPAASTVAFDAAHAGTPQTVGWIGGGDAILAYDLNGDGMVDPSTEITFKPDVAVATNSLGGLSAFDTNGNGYLDPGDAGWSKFLVWHDVNGNGVSDPGETETLTQAGVAKLALTPTITTPDNGDPSSNEVLAQSSVTLTDGSVRTAYDVALGVKGASAPASSTSTTATSAGASSPTSTAPASVTPAVKAAASPQSAAASLTAQAAPASTTAGQGNTSVARAAEDGPQTPQGAQYAGNADTGAVSGWWSAPASSSSVLGSSGLSSLTAGGTGPASSLAAPISTSPDAATLQQQQLLRQSLASFTAPASSSSAVWARQPAIDLMPTLAAAQPLAPQNAPLPTLGG